MADHNHRSTLSPRTVLPLLLLLFWVPNTSTHVALTFPPARRFALDFLDSSRTRPPCGMPRGDIKTTLLSGSKLNVTWHLGYPHRGGFKLQLLDVLERPVLDLTPTIQGSDFISTDATAQHYLVQLPPEFVCTNCTVRLLRQALEWQSDYKFWSCADVDIKLRKDFRETCSGHGRYLLGRCKCDRLYYGATCEIKDECVEDGDCGTHGKCIDVGGTTLPRHQCYCQVGWFGRGCNRRSPIKTLANIDLAAYRRHELAPTLLLYYRILRDHHELEVILVANTTNYVALGWRPQTLTAICKNFPEISGAAPEAALTPQGVAEPTAEPEPEPEPTTATSTTTTTLVPASISLRSKLKGKYGRALYGRRSTNEHHQKTPNADVVETSVSYKVSSTNSGRNKRQHRIEPRRSQIKIPKPEPEPEPEPEPKAEPEPEPEPQPEPTTKKDGSSSTKKTTTSEGLHSYTPRHDFHAMDCADIIIGTVRGNYSRIGDYYTRDRSTPQLDNFWGGRDDLTAAIGYEHNGTTMVLFRRSLRANHGSDHAIVDAPMHVIYAVGQPTTHYVHWPQSGLETGPATLNDFYKDDELKYHGHGAGQRGATTMNFYESVKKTSTIAVQQNNPSDDSESKAPSMAPKSVDAISEENAICGGSWKLPKSCNATQLNCDYALEWRFLTANEIQFTIRTKQVDSWTGVGFSQDERMSGTDAILGWVDQQNGRAFLMDTWINGYTQPLLDPSQDIYNASGQLVDGSTVLSFVRRRHNADHRDVSLDQCVYLMYPVKGGAFNAVNKKIRKHETVPIVSAERVCFKPCAAVLNEDGADNDGSSNRGAYGIQLKFVDLVAPPVGTIEFNDLSNSIRYNVMRSVGISEQQYRLTVVNVEQEAQNAVATLNLLYLGGADEDQEKSRSLAGDAINNHDIGGGGNGGNDAIFELLHKSLQTNVGSGLVGNLRVDPTFLVFAPQSVTTNINDGSNGDANGFFKLSEAKLYIVLGCITALVLVAILQAGCTIYKTVNRGQSSQKDHLIPNSAWKDYSSSSSAAAAAAAINSSYAFDRFDGAADEKYYPPMATTKVSSPSTLNHGGGHHHHQKHHHQATLPHQQQRNGHQQRALPSTHADSNNHRNGYHHHHTATTNHYQRPMNDTKSLQRNTSSTMNHYACTDPMARSTFSLPRHAAAATSTVYGQQQQPDFYFMPSQRKYSGEVVRVYVDYNNQTMRRE